MDRHEFQNTVANLKNIIPQMDSPQEALEAIWLNLKDDIIAYFCQNPRLFVNFKRVEGVGGALDCKKRGNDEFQRKNFYQALVCYNEALCKAITGSELMGQLYANRSAVYLESRYFSLCLKNIQLARENNYPRADLSKLEKREQRCLDAMAAVDGDDAEAFYTPPRKMELSFSANPKNPMMVEGIKATLTAAGKIELRAERDFGVGDFLIRETHLMSLISPSTFQTQRCLMCLKPNSLSLKPCKGCIFVMFCSDSCEEQALNEFHRLECASLKVLYKDDVPNQWTMGRIAARTLVRIMSIYPNLDQLRRHIAQWRKNPTKLFEENNEDPELLQIKLLFGQKMDVPMSKMFDKGLEMSKLLAILLRNPHFATRINSRDDELLVLGILFTISIYKTPNQQFAPKFGFIISLRPFFEMLHEDVNISNMSSLTPYFEKATFFLATRPIKKDQLIVINETSKTRVDLDSGIPYEEWKASIFNFESDTPAGIRFGDFDFKYEYHQLFVAFPTKEFILEAEKRYKAVLTAYGHHWPCKELTNIIIMYIYCVGYNYFDNDYITKLMFKEF